MSLIKLTDEQRRILMDTVRKFAPTNTLTVDGQAILTARVEVDLQIEVDFEDVQVAEHSAGYPSLTVITDAAAAAQPSLTTGEQVLRFVPQDEARDPVAEWEISDNVHSEIEYSVSDLATEYLDVSGRSGIEILSSELVDFSIDDVILSPTSAMAVEKWNEAAEAEAEQDAEEDAA